MFHTPINDNLLATVSTIFKSFFLDYSSVDLPLVQSEYGEIPAGWKYVNLGDLCKTVTKGTTPTTLGKDFVSHGINFIKGESIGEDHSFNPNLFAFIDDETNTLLKRSQIENQDILFSIAGTLGKFAMANESILPANTNQAVAIIRVDKNKILPEILYSYFIGGWQTEFYKRNTQQAVQANLSLATIKDLPLLLPDEISLNSYSRLVMPLLSEVWKNHLQIEKLLSFKEQFLATISLSR